MVTAEVTFDNSYASGGESLTPTMLGMRAIEHLMIEQDAQAGLRSVFDRPYNRLIVYGLDARVLSVPYCAAATSANDVAGTTNYSALQANCAAVAALATANANALTIAAQPVTPRNICIAQKNTGGANPANSTARTYAVVGVFNGAAQTDSISIPGSVSMASNKGILVYGTKPFDSVTSITPSGAGTSGFEHAAGIGSVLGLPATLATPAYTDIVQITKQGAAVPAVTGSSPGAGKLNATKDGLDVGDITANDNIVVKLLAQSPVWEVLAGKDLSALVIRVIAVGY